LFLAGGASSEGQGGSGGGRLKLYTTKAQIDGSISADGADALYKGAAGGAGGSILLYVNGSINGVGNITAFGGDGRKELMALTEGEEQADG